MKYLILSAALVDSNTSHVLIYRFRILSDCGAYVNSNTSHVLIYPIPSGVYVPI